MARIRVNVDKIEIDSMVDELNRLIIEHIRNATNVVEINGVFRWGNIRSRQDPLGTSANPSTADDVTWTSMPFWRAQYECPYTEEDLRDPEDIYHMRDIPASKDVIEGRCWDVEEPKPLLGAGNERS